MQALKPQYLDWSVRGIIENISHHIETTKEHLEGLRDDIEEVEKQEPLRRLSLPPNRDQRADYRESSARILEEVVFTAIGYLDCFEEDTGIPMDSVKECIAAIGEAAFSAGMRGELADYAEMKDGARLALECFLEATENARMKESMYRQEEAQRPCWEV